MAKTAIKGSTGGEKGGGRDFVKVVVSQMDIKVEIIERANLKHMEFMSLFTLQKPGLTM